MTRPARTELTKSLHTVSAVVNVAAHLAMNGPDGTLHGKDALTLVREALAVLGQPSDWPESDPVILAAVKQLMRTGVAAHTGLDS
jgi:myo-inositol catabolism protein IolC